MERIRTIWIEFTAPRAIEEGEARREYFTKALLILTAVPLDLFTFIILIGWITGLFEPYSLSIMLIADLPLAVGWWFAYHGRWRVGSYVLPALFYLLGLYGVYAFGLISTFLLFFVLAMLLASLLLSSRMQWALLLLSVVIPAVIAVTRTESPPAELLPVVIMITGIFLGITLLQRFSVTEIGRALAKADKSAAVLEEASLPRLAQALPIPCARLAPLRAA